MPKKSLLEDNICEIKTWLEVLIINPLLVKTKLCNYRKIQGIGTTLNSSVYSLTFSNPVHFYVFRIKINTHNPELCMILTFTTAFKWVVMKQ